MPDMMDAAQESAEFFNEAAIACRTPPAPIQHHSHCAWCREPLPPKHGKFCDARCRDDSAMWERRHQFVGGNDA